MKLKIESLLLTTAILVPALIIYKAFFTSGPLVWGDAPYFYSEGLRELTQSLHIWSYRADNFGGVDKILWIYPLMYIYGSLHTLFGLNNDIIIRVIFYLPSVLLAFISPFLLTRYLGFSKITRFFTSLLYGLNTYFILLIDGGQLGISLAYGFLPLVILTLLKLVKTRSITFFFASIFTLQLLTIFDPRFTVMAFITILVWTLLDISAFKKTKQLINLTLLIPLILILLLFNFYWLIPLLKLGNQSSLYVSDLRLISLLNSLLLYQPHWPLNQFGKIIYPPFYFVGILILLFTGIFLKPEKKKLIFSTVFLFLAFLSKGETPPFGDYYSWLISNIPFGSAFRDSTKFFAPMFLFAGMLIGSSVEQLTQISPRWLKGMVPISVYIYLLFLLWPALNGDLTGVLGAKTFPEDFSTVADKLIQDQGLFRTVWFPHKHPYAYQNINKPALDAEHLVSMRPFASLNTGTYDTFNFINNKQFVDWFDLYSIKYIFLTGDSRKKEFTKEDIEDWNNLNKLIATSSGLTKPTWNIGFPVYSLDIVKPPIFAVDKALLVIGGDDVYDVLNSNMDRFSVGNQAFLFLEDGKFDIEQLKNIDSEDLVIIFNKKTEVDLTMAFLKKFVLDLQSNVLSSEWALRSTADYLKYKYELLINGLDIKEFDYGKGIAFSTQKGEVIEIGVDIPKDGQYFLAVRSLTKDISDNLSYEFGGAKKQISQKVPGIFEWSLSGPLFLKQGHQKIIIKNIYGMHVLNTLALVPEDEFEKAQQKTEEFIDNFVSIDIDMLKNDKSQQLPFQSSWSYVNFERVSEEEYRIFVPKKGRWLVFTNSFNPGWNSLPFYSAVNGYYLKTSEGNSFTIRFKI